MSYILAHNYSKGEELMIPGIQGLDLSWNQAVDHVIYYKPDWKFTIDAVNVIMSERVGSRWHNWSTSLDEPDRWLSETVSFPQEEYDKLYVKPEKHVLPKDPNPNQRFLGSIFNMEDP